MILGEAEVDDIHIDVRCERYGEVSAMCEVHFTALVRAETEVSLRWRDPLSASVTRNGIWRRVSTANEWCPDGGTTVDDEPLFEPLVVGAGHQVRLRSYRRVQVGGGSDLAMRWLFLPTPLFTRHPFFGEHDPLSHGVSDVAPRVAFVTGDRTLVRPSHFHLAHQGDVVVRVGERIVEDHEIAHARSLTLEFRPTVPMIRNGGPVLIAGVSDFGGARAPNIGLAYEFRLASDFVLVSGELAIDLNPVALFESVVIELGGSLFWTASAGVGVVMRQLGDRDADVGARIRFAINLWLPGVMFDIDLWPSQGTATFSMRGRLSF